MITFASLDTRDPRCHTGCPSFFKACCAEAAAGQGYAHPGFHFAIHLEGLVPYAIENDYDRDQFLNEFRTRIGISNDVEMFAWFMRWFPECMKLVPDTQRRSFIRGVRAGAAKLGWVDPDEE
jgi:hypothetical protein